MYILFCCPLPFENEHIIMIQTNAILSWKKLELFDKIILTGNEHGVEEFCRKHDFIHEPNIETSKHNTPLISSIFNQSMSYSQNENDIFIYINCDIILLSNFKQNLTHIINNIQNQTPCQDFLIIGQKINWWNIHSIDFNEPNYEDKLIESINGSSELHPTTGIDYWIFKKNTYVNKIPPFLIGRWYFDGCLVHIAKKNDNHVINATKILNVIHQDTRILSKSDYHNKSTSSLVKNTDILLEERHYNEHIARQHNLTFHSIDTADIIL